MSRMVYEDAAYVAFLGLTRVQVLRAESIEDRLTALRGSLPGSVGCPRKPLLLPIVAALYLNADIMHVNILVEACT